MMKLIEELIRKDDFMSACRAADTWRYVAAKWNALHTAPIDENEVALFLADEHYGKLTEEQKQFVRECLDEMNSVYRNAAFRVLLFLEMRRQGMVSDLADFWRVYLSDSFDGYASGGTKREAGRKERRSSGAAPLTNARSAGISGLLKERFSRRKNRRMTLLSGARPEKARQSRRFNDAISILEVIL